MIIHSLLLKRLAYSVYLSLPTYFMFMFVLSFNLYSMAVKDGCSMLSVECKASANRTMHLNYILSSTANATLCLNFNNNFRFQSIHLYFGIDEAKPFLEIPCENQT